MYVSAANISPKVPYFTTLGSGDAVSSWGALVSVTHPCPWHAGCGRNVVVTIRLDAPSCESAWSSDEGPAADSLVRVSTPVASIGHADPSWASRNLAPPPRPCQCGQDAALVGKGPFAQMHPFGVTHPEASPNLALHLLTYDPCWIPHADDKLPWGEIAWRKAAVRALTDLGVPEKILEK